MHKTAKAPASMSGTLSHTSHSQSESSDSKCKNSIFTATLGISSPHPIADASSPSHYSAEWSLVLWFFLRSYNIGRRPLVDAEGCVWAVVDEKVIASGMGLLAGLYLPMTSFLCCNSSSRRRCRRPLVQTTWTGCRV